MALPKIDWEDLLTKIAIGVFILFFCGMTLYAMHGMTDEEKTNFIMMLQQEQLQE
jgi:hypothetical protein